MRRKFESGASKRQRKQQDEASAKDFRPITSFLKQVLDPIYPTNTSLVDDNSENSSDDNPISKHGHEEICNGNTPAIHVTRDPIHSQEAQQHLVDIYLTRMTIASVPNLGLIDKRDTFLKINCF